MAGYIHLGQSMGDELADNRAPGIALVLSADAESGELVVAEVRDARVGLAQQNRNDMCLPEALARAVDAGEKFLGGDGAVKSLRRVEADVAIAARLAVVAEIAQQHLPATLAGFCEAQQRVELAMLHSLACIRGLRLLDEAAAK